MKNPNWKLPPKPPVLSDEMRAKGFPELLAAVLEERSRRSEEDKNTIENMLHCNDRLLSDPMDFTGMAEAKARLEKAMERGEHVAVYGDYDVDGITSVCLLTDYLRSRGLECESYIPNRIREGYGVNCGAIDRLHGMGVTLIITVDCGVTSVEETAYAGSLGMDMIVTDHHQCGDKLPDAVAVIDPKRSPREPGQDLAGVGVAFKLVCALHGNQRETLKKYGDLVAAGTVADVMSLRNENRYLVGWGLKYIESAMKNGTGEYSRPGVVAMMRELCGEDRKVTSGTIGYSFAPRINAAGRMNEIEKAIGLLQAKNSREAADYVADLNRLNKERQNEEHTIWEEAEEMLGGIQPGGPIVLYSEKWHAGVIGIVASRLADKYGVPAVMICLSDSGAAEGKKIWKGSCRSVGNFNIYEALGRCSEECLEGFGGHPMAAGITVKPGMIDTLRQRLNEMYSESGDYAPPALEPELWIDRAELLTEECVASLDRLEPCGNGNPRPLLYMDNVTVKSFKPVGDGKHLRFQADALGQTYECIWFNRTEREPGCREGGRADIVFNPQISVFRGKTSVQLVITDLRPHAASAR